MIYLLLKAGLTGSVVVAVSEIAKRSSFMATLLASLPLTSVLAFVWFYQETKDVQAVRTLSYGIFWMVIPSLVFFLALPLFLKEGIRFYGALVLACLCTAFIYILYVKIMRLFGIMI